MIELKHDWVRLAAINARICKKVLSDHLSMLLPSPPIRLGRLLLNFLPVPFVVGPLIIRLV